MSLRTAMLIAAADHAATPSSLLATSTKTVPATSTAADLREQLFGRGDGEGTVQPAIQRAVAVGASAALS